MASVDSHRGDNMGWRSVAAGIGTGTTVQALKAVESKVSKRKFKRLIATAVAELLALHPDIGKSKARRRARRITGARPSKKLMRATSQIGLKEGAEAVVGAAATAGLAKVAGVVGAKLKEKFDDGDETRHLDQGKDGGRREPAEV
jgi:hypothetical protein